MRPIENVSIWAAAAGRVFVKGRCAVHNGTCMTQTRSTALWLGETLSEAVSTTVLMTVLAFAEAERPIHNDLSFRLFAGVSAVVLIEFAMTGYLVTTAIAALFLPQRGKYFYPAACFCSTFCTPISSSLGRAILGSTRGMLSSR